MTTPASWLRGFTLLEVMVALLVITIGLGAVIESTGSATWNATYLKQKTIAGWVAQNQIAVYRARRIWNNASSRQGSVEMAGALWRWKMKISKTDDPALRRLDVDVFLDGDDAVKSSMTGFIGHL